MAAVSPPAGKAPAGRIWSKLPASHWASTLSNDSVYEAHVSAKCEFVYACQGTVGNCRCNPTAKVGSAVKRGVTRKRPTGARATCAVQYTAQCRRHAKARWIESVNDLMFAPTQTNTCTCTGMLPFRGWGRVGIFDQDVVEQPGRPDDGDLVLGLWVELLLAWFHVPKSYGERHPMV